MTHRFLEGLRPTVHIAHRGGAELAPENTLVAFRSAVERWRTQMLELDVHATRDGELVVAHDATVDRCTDGTGPVAGFDWTGLAKLDAGYRFSPGGAESSVHPERSEAQSRGGPVCSGRTEVGPTAHPFRGQGVRIPRLVEVLRAFPDLRLNIELKAAGLEVAFASLVRGERAFNRVCVGSEDDGVAARLHQALPEACHFYPRDALAAFVIAVKGHEPPPLDDRFTVLDMPLEFQGMRLFDAEFRDAAAACGRWVNLWTIDDAAEMRRLIAEGAGGIMTDRPDLLRAELDRT